MLFLDRGWKLATGKVLLVKLFLFLRCLEQFVSNLAQGVTKKIAIFGPFFRIEDVLVLQSKTYSPERVFRCLSYLEGVSFFQKSG